MVTEQPGTEESAVPPVPAGYRRCTCGHRLMDHVIAYGGLCKRYQCRCNGYMEVRKP